MMYADTHFRGPLRPTAKAAARAGSHARRWHRPMELGCGSRGLSHVCRRHPAKPASREIVAKVGAAARASGWRAAVLALALGCACSSLFGRDYVLTDTIALADVRGDPDDVAEFVGEQVDYLEENLGELTDETNDHEERFGYVQVLASRAIASYARLADTVGDGLDGDEVSLYGKLHARLQTALMAVIAHSAARVNVESISSHDLGLLDSDILGPRSHPYVFPAMMAYRLLVQSLRASPVEIDSNLYQEALDDIETNYRTGQLTSARRQRTYVGLHELAIKTFDFAFVNTPKVPREVTVRADLMEEFVENASGLLADMVGSGPGSLADIYGGYLVLVNPYAPYLAQLASGVTWADSYSRGVRDLMDGYREVYRDTVYWDRIRRCASGGTCYGSAVPGRWPEFRPSHGCGEEPCPTFYVPKEGKDRLEAYERRIEHLEQLAGESDDHGDTTSEATLVEGSEAEVQGYLAVGDVDYFRVDVAGSGSLLVYTRGDTDTFGRLLDSSGAELASNDNTSWWRLGRRINFRIEEEVSRGTHYIAVSAAGGAAGPYTLRMRLDADDLPPVFDHGDTVTTATDVAVPSDTVGTLFPEDVDAFRVNVSRAGTLTALHQRLFQHGGASP